jgi:hypothetical protein
MSLLPELLSLFNSGGSLDSGLPKLVRQLRVLRALRSFKMIAKFGTLKVFHPSASACTNWLTC